MSSIISCYLNIYPVSANYFNAVNFRGVSSEENKKDNLIITIKQTKKSFVCCEWSLRGL